VLASNNDGIWSETPAVIRIVRKPAPWFSWPAYVLYTLFILGVLFLIIRYYNEKKNLKMQLYLDNIEKDKKEEILQSQLRFFTNISHDFRTPLSLIMASLDRLREDGIKEYYYRILNRNTQRLLNLVNELMDFRTVENGKMNLGIQLLDLNSFLEVVASDFSDYAKQRDIDFKVVCDPALQGGLYADKKIVEKIVMNLLNNAFKYSKEGSSISLETYSDINSFKSQYENSHTVRGDQAAEKTFSIVVRDTGVGISKESISSVFERFYKVNTVNADSHLGTGIGLALVKSFVLLHKGTITIFSEREKGTDMVVCLPSDTKLYKEGDFLKEKIVMDDIAKGEKEDVNEKLDEDILLCDKKKVLIVEDNEDLRSLIADSLSTDYEIIGASDGLAASKLVNSMEPDLIISDIMMPLKDGVTLCHEIKSNIDTSHIPFILLTAKTSLESKIEGVDSGADMYFEKPVNLNFLRISINNIFKHQQQLKEHYAKNYFADSAELSSNEHDNKFLKKFIDIIEANIDQSEMDVNYIATELSVSRSKLYTKIKTLTGKSIVEFILNYRLRKAARLIIEEDMTMREIMAQIGIESQPYFTNAFKKEFEQTPTAFAAKHKKKNK
jgi:signal transduction histidine kinase/DNA-binding response OmpR family regulator